MGSSTVTYEWKRVLRGDHVRSKQSDFVQRFFCHYPRSMLKPGESKAFTFSFKSAKVGMFNEEWELLTEPLLQTPLSLVSLSGIATQEDQLKSKRDEFWTGFSQGYLTESQPSIDMLEGFVRNQPAMVPDLKDPVVLCNLFEERNKHLGLFFTKDGLETFFEIFDDVCFILTSQGSPDVAAVWDTRVETLSSLIKEIKNKYTFADVNDRFVKTLYSAKKTPNDRALSYTVLQRSIGSFVENVVDHDCKARIAMELPMLETWQCIPEEWTQEQRLAFVAAEAAKVSEALKKNKKKPKTAEEDAKDKEELLSKVCSTLSTQFTESEIDKCESEIELLKTEWLMMNHLKMDSDAFEKLNRKMSILDMDISDLDVVLRCDMDVPLTPYVPLPPLEEEFKELLEAQEAEAAQASQKKKAKKSKKQLEEEAELLLKYEQGKLARDEPWKMRQVTDHRLLRRTEASVKLL